MVGGVGERVAPMPFAAQRYVLLRPPFGTDTGAVYRAFDEGARPDGDWVAPRWLADPSAPAAPGTTCGPNDLVRAALTVDRRLADWGRLLAETTGRPVMLAGSGSTWFVAGRPEELGLGGRTTLGPPSGSKGPAAHLWDVRTVPPAWDGD